MTNSATNQPTWQVKGSSGKSYQTNKEQIITLAQDCTREQLRNDQPELTSAKLFKKSRPDLDSTIQMQSLRGSIPNTG